MTAGLVLYGLSGDGGATLSYGFSDGEYEREFNEANAGHPLRYLSICTLAEALAAREMVGALKLLTSPSTSSFDMRGSTSIGWQHGEGISASERVSAGRFALQKAGVES